MSFLTRIISSARIILLPTVKFVVGAVSSKFSSKIYLWGYQSGEVIPSVEDQNCDGMCPDHP